MDTSWRFKRNDKKRMCDGCDKVMYETLLVYDGGFYLCKPCKDYMDKTYAELIREETAE